jgi:hypothetical protein
MQRQSLFITFAGVFLAIGITAALVINAQVGRRNGEASKGEAANGATTQAGEYTLSGPFVHENLSIFLVHGKNLLDSNFLTLQEALEQKKVKVYETKDVNELAIQNFSEQDVYVQSGDIVKGGDQDRMISIDFIVPPRSGRLPIAAFCVEQGRWHRRGNEEAATFTSSADAAATKDLRVAAKQANSQSGVWENVAVTQRKLSENVGTTVNSVVSQTSLQLSVENRKVQETSAAYIKALEGVVRGRNDVIGYVFAINGEINSADVYASSALFKKLWPKLLKANAVEAIAEKQQQKFDPPTAEAATAFLSASTNGDLTEKEITQRVKLVTREDENHLFFETRDRKQKDAWVHRNYIKK